MNARARRVRTAIARSRGRLARLLGLAALLLLVLSAVRFRITSTIPIPEVTLTPDSQFALSVDRLRPVAPASQVEQAAALMLLGGLCWIAALRLSPARLAPPFPLPAQRRGGAELDRKSPPHLVEKGFRGRANRRRTALARVLILCAGIVCLALAAEASGDRLGFAALEQLSPLRQFVLLGGGIGLATAGLGGISLPRQRPALAWRTALPLLAITALAFGVRVWRLNDTVHIFVDELNFATAVHEYWDRGTLELLVPINGIIAFPRLYTYWQAQAVALLGRNLAGLRLTSAILGTLTVPALYLLARALFDRPTALIAALLLAAFPPHVHFSRLALNNVADPLFGVLALALFARGFRSGKQADYALAGAALGLTQYFYEGGRLIFAPLALAWIGLGALAWKPRPLQRGVLVAALAALLVAAPVYYTLAARDAPFTARMNGTLLNRDYWRGVLLSPSDSKTFRDHLQRIEQTFLIYLHRPEGGFFYAGVTPFVLVYLTPALLLGLFTALAHLRRPGPLLLVLWVLLTSGGNSFLAASIDAPRYVVVFPALALLSAVGLRAALGLLWPRGTRPRLRCALAAALVLAATAGQIAYYFGPHVDLFNRQIREIKPYPDGEDALFRSVDFPPGTQIHLISGVVFDQSYADQTLRFLSDDLAVETLGPQGVTVTWLWSLPRTADHAFFLEPDDIITLDMIRDYFSLDPPSYTFYDVPRSRELVLYYAPALVR